MCLVLYNELPTYNDKRRGTISAATLRNLQRSRRKPLLFGNERADTSLSVSQADDTRQIHSDTVSQAGVGGSTPSLSAAPHVRSSVMANVFDQ